MAKQLDTSWFDLKNYESFKTMSVAGWIWQLEARDYYHRIERDRAFTSHDEKDRWFSSITTKLKAGVIPDDPNYPTEIHDIRAGAILEGHPFSTASVNSLTSYELWQMAKNNDLSYVWDACQHEHDFAFAFAFALEEELNNELSEIAQTPHDFNNKQVFDYWKEAHVVINLSATDEQIKNDVNHWLTHYRKAVAYQRQKKLFNQVDFDYWVEYGVIPYLDLVLIAKTMEKKMVVG